MTVRVYTGGKVAKKAGASASAALIDGLPEGRVQVVHRLSPPDLSPTLAQTRAAALGVAVALHKGATRVEVVTPSKALARALHSDGCPEGGGLLVGWLIHWTRDRCPDGWAVELRPAREMPDVAEALAHGIAELPSEPELALFS